MSGPNGLHLSAETPVPDEMPDITGDAERPLTEWLRGYTDNDLALFASEHLVEPALRILVILVLASVVLVMTKRAINRAVRSWKDPDAPRGRRLRQRVGLFDERRTVVSARRTQRADAMGALFSSGVSVVIWIIVVFMILDTFGINLGPLIAGAGIIGLALGFGAQDVVKDFLSGVFMLLEDQYGVGDIIDAGDAVGVVEAVTLRTTRIRDITGTLWHVPNGEITRIGNKSQEWARALLDVAVSYGTDVDAASELIQRVASEMAHEDEYRDLFLGEPEIWGVENLGNDSVDVRLVIKTQPGEQWSISREVRRRIKVAFDSAEVEIPFPQRTVWLRTEQPVTFGGADAAPFSAPVPDESAMRRAVEKSKRGDTGAARTTGEFLPDEFEVDAVEVTDPDAVDGSDAAER